MAILMQIYGGVITCSLMMVMSTMYAWPSSIVNNFKSNETVLSHAMGPYEVALFGSLSSVGALVGTPLFGYLSDSIGRKYSCIAAGIPFLVAWSMIATFRQVEVVLVALFIAGFGAATGFISPVFVSEICQDSLRGVMTISTVIFYNSGILLSYLLGGHLSYYCFVYVQIIISALYIILANFLKDSPVHLMNKGRESEAATSIAFYRSVAPDSKEVLEELDNIKKTLNLESCGQTFPDSSEEAKLNQTPQPSNDEYVSPLRYLLKSQSSRRALAVCLMMITAANLMGMVVVLVYAEPIFEDAVPSMPATLCTIMLAVVMIVATVASASLVNRAGRKVVMLYSTGGSAVVTLLLGFQIHLRWGPHVLIAILIYVFCFVYGIGAGTIPYVLFCEVFVPEVKGFCLMLVTEWAWLCSFIALFVFNPLVDAMGLGPVFYIFSVICLCTAIFCYFFQPETKGLSVDVIQMLLTKKVTSVAI